MLTLPETIAALRALDTEPDIIAQACEALLAPADAREGSIKGDAYDVAEYLALKYLHRVDTPHTLLLASAIMAGTLGATMTRLDATGEMLKQLHNLLAETFADILQQRVMKAMVNNPAKGIADLMTILQSIPKTKGD